MASTHQMTAAEDRALPLRKRADLEISESWFQQERSWIIKDPVSLRYHRLREAEMIVLSMVDGQTTLRQIKEKLQDRFPTKIARLNDLQQLLAALFRAGMLLSDAPGQAEQLLERARETRRREWAGRLSNVLAIRFPGFDPERLLTWLHPKLGWIFAASGRRLWLVCALLAAALLLSNLEEFQRRLPSFQEFFSVGNFFWLAVVMGTTKICHELGHGLSCKHFGGECHEIGMMLLVFTPAMYCDTSDSWLLPNKWHRAFIGAAGMYVEVFLASVATFGWWYTQPGLLNFMFLNVMFVSSVSTIVFNANPLLRYDGYYILSDILEIPNLAQKSRLAMLNLLRVQCLGLQPVSQRQLPQRNHFMFATYSVASFLYRWFVLIMIVWFVNSFFEPYGLQIIGQAVIAVSAVGLIGMPLWQLVQFFAVPGRLQEVKIPRLVMSLVVLVLIVAGIVLVPLPRRVMTSAVVRPDDADRVYVAVPGTLRDVYVRPGDQVQPGELLADLENTDAALRLAVLEGERAQQELHLQNLIRRQTDDPRASIDIPAAEAALQDIQQQLVELRQDQRRLKLTAARAGSVMPPPELAENPRTGELPTWSGTPFDEHNRGARLESGTLFCAIGDPRKMKATLVFEQSHIQHIRVGQKVSILLDEYPHQPLQSTIREIAKIDMRLPPRELTTSAGGPLATQIDPATGQPKLMFVMFEASVPLPATEIELLNGFRGTAKVYAEPESLGKRLVQFTRNTLHFR